ncbi:MAG: hypothetical protein ACJA2C_001060 [Marinoscillum sp.]|jgi:hypothetical protein
MAITRLERKGKKNISRAKNKVISVKRLNAMPVIKNVDIEEMKKSFAAPVKDKEAEAPANEAVAVEETVAPKENAAAKNEESKED